MHRFRQTPATRSYFASDGRFKDPDPDIDCGGKESIARSYRRYFGIGSAHVRRQSVQLTHVTRTGKVWFGLGIAEFERVPPS
jgi:hypothetical protein